MVERVVLRKGEKLFFFFARRSIVDGRRQRRCLSLLLFSRLYTDQLTYQVRHIERHIVVPCEKVGAGQGAAGGRRSGAPFRFSHLKKKKEKRQFFFLF